MTNQSIVASALSIGSSQIRCLDGLYSLNDLHQASGGEKKHQPSNFLRLEATKALINEIDASSHLRSLNTVAGKGRPQGSYVCKELVIAYAAWISPAFHLQVIRVFLDSQKAPAANTLPAVRVITTEEQTAINMRAHVLAQEKYREIRGELMADYLAGRVDDLDKWTPTGLEQLPFNPVSTFAYEKEVNGSVYHSRRYLMYFDGEGKPIVYGLDNEEFVTSARKLSMHIREGSTSPFDSVKVAEILQACADRLAYESKRGHQ